LLCLALSPLAQAQSAGTKEALYVKSLAATCANCHGTNGKVVDGSAVTSLAGLDKNYIVAQMKAFKDFKPGDPAGHGDAPDQQGLQRRADRVAGRLLCRAKEVRKKTP
jgi:cytochrome c553